MAIDANLEEELSVQRRTLRDRYAISEKTQWGWHAYGRMALVIFADGQQKLY